MTELGHVRVVPSQARPAAPGSRCQLLTPVSVLGFEPDGVALWVGTPARPAVQVVVETRQVAAVETMHILLYARLTVHAAHARLSVLKRPRRPRTTYLLLALRQRAALAEDDVPRTPAPDAGLPHKWGRLLASDAARLVNGEPIASVRGPLSVPRHAEAAYAAVCLSTRELVVLSDPVHTPSAAGRCGVDAHCILPHPDQGRTRRRPALAGAGVRHRPRAACRMRTCPAVPRAFSARAEAEGQ